MSSARIYRVILPIEDIESSARFYTTLLGFAGERVSPGRHYFACGGVLLALFSPRADGDNRDPRPNQDHVYFSVADLEAVHTRATSLGGLSPVMGAIDRRPWGEVSFYMKDPFGNPLCFVQEGTEFLTLQKESR